MDRRKNGIQNNNIRKHKNKIKNARMYNVLKRLDRCKAVIYKNTFTCVVCTEDYGPGKGIILSRCLHVFCKQCIKTYIQMSTDVEIKCPYMDNTYSCEEIILQTEIKRLVGKKLFEKYLKRSLEVGVNCMEDAVRCPKPNCEGVYIKGNDMAEQWVCEICNIPYCLKCEGLHNNIVMSCEDYKKTLENANLHSENMVTALLDTSNAMKCPKCGVVIEKTDGCDSLKCTQCRTLLCWATKGARWGPGGKGDTSGGCRCGVERACHPKCNGCH